EARVLHLEVAVRLRDSALAQDQRLLALGQRLADDGPLLERVLQHVDSLSLNWRVAPVGARSPDRAPAPTAGLLSSRAGDLRSGQGRGQETPPQQEGHPFI